MPAIDEMIATAGAEPMQYEAEKPLVLRYYESLSDHYEFRYNEITDIIEFRKRKENGKPQAWQHLEERDLNTMWLDFQLDGNYSSKEKPTDKKLAKLIFSRLTPTYNEFDIYLQSLQYKNTPAIERLAGTLRMADVPVGGTDLHTLVIPLLRRWMIAAVACALGKAPNQVMLLLMGPQGKFKTTWLNRLCPPALQEYRFTGHIQPDLADKQTANLLAEKIILNIDDQLETIFGKDFNKIKSIISIDKISNRKAYRRDDKNRPRRANIVGSVNAEKLFLDSENRRYLTFKVTDIDITTATEIDINEVWAEAYHYYSKGERYWFDAKEVGLINEINNVFAINTPEEEFLQRCFDPVTEAEPEHRWLTFNEILTALRQISGQNLRDGNLRNAMRKSGWPQAISKRAPGRSTAMYLFCVQENFERDSLGKAYMKGQPAPPPVSVPNPF